MKKILLSTLLAFGTFAHTNTPAQSALPTETTHQIESAFSFQETVSRLEKTIIEKGMTVFATIDHQAAAKAAGLEMQAATVLVYGNPKAGTPLMVKDPALALQLPLRVLVTEVEGKVKVMFLDTRAVIAGSAIEYAEVENTLAKAENLIRQTVNP